jgi:hypothetical protein
MKASIWVVFPDPSKPSKVMNSPRFIFNLN